MVKVENVKAPSYVKIYHRKIQVCMVCNSKNVGSSYNIDEDNGYINILSYLD